MNPERTPETRSVSPTLRAEIARRKMGLNRHAATHGLLVSFLPERDCVTFGSLLSQIQLSSLVCNVRAPYSEVETFGNISSPFCTLAIL